jgi:uncharacterized protein
MRSPLEKNKNTMMSKYLLIGLTILLSFNLSAQTLPDMSNPPRLVNDFAEIMTEQDRLGLEDYLVKFNNETSTQIAVVTVKSLEGTDAGDFAFKLGEKWGIGQKGKNNGILILIKPKYGNEKGQAFIATGYGLEGAVPDAYASRIVDNEMIPRFKTGDYFGGISAAVKVITELTKGEYTADQYVKKTEGSKFGLVFIVFIIVFIIIIISKAGSNSKNLSSNGSSLPFWLLMGGLAANSRHHGSYGNFSSGSGGFGGGGGGFGGFGGGGFGGGGAGGSW